MDFGLKLFIETYIDLINANEFDKVFYAALSDLDGKETKQLIDIFEQINPIDYKPALEKALEVHALKVVPLKTKQKVVVYRMAASLPHFGLNSIEFQDILINAVLSAYPNKEVVTDNDGLECFVEKD